MDDISALIQELNRSRGYTNRLLDTIDEVDWFRQPSEGVSHIAWQVGHLAVAQYRLALLVVRGQQPDDGQLISESFINRFQPGSLPDPTPHHNPSVGEIRDVFNRVHSQAVAETQKLPQDSLNEPISFEHPMFSTKSGAIRWSAQHEFTHAGQISLLRRLLGNTPLW